MTQKTYEYDDVKQSHSNIKFLFIFGSNTKRGEVEITSLRSNGGDSGKKKQIACEKMLQIENFEKSKIVRTS